MPFENIDRKTVEEIPLIKSDDDCKNVYSRGSIKMVAHTRFDKNATMHLIQKPENLTNFDFLTGMGLDYAIRLRDDKILLYMFIISLKKDTPNKFFPCIYPWRGGYEQKTILVNFLSDFLSDPGKIPEIPFELIKCFLALGITILKNASQNNPKITEILNCGSLNAYLTKECELSKKFIEATSLAFRAKIILHNIDEKGQIYEPTMDFDCKKYISRITKPIHIIKTINNMVFIDQNKDYFYERIFSIIIKNSIMF